MRSKLFGRPALIFSILLLKRTAATAILPAYKLGAVGGRFAASAAFATTSSHIFVDTQQEAAAATENIIALDAARKKGEITNICDETRRSYRVSSTPPFQCYFKHGESEPGEGAAQTR